MSDQEAEFTCAMCGQTFAKVWTDEEAKAEADVLWGDLARYNLAVICDDCFHNQIHFMGTDEPVTAAAPEPRWGDQYHPSCGMPLCKKVTRRSRRRWRGKTRSAADLEALLEDVMRGEGGGQT